MIFHNKYSLVINNSTKERIIDKIVSELKKSKIDFIDNQENEISFRNRFWKFGTPYLSMANINKGIFKLKVEDNNIEVFYESFSSFYIDIALIIILFVLGIIFDHFFMLGSIIFLIQIFISISIIKAENKSLMNKISYTN